MKICACPVLIQPVRVGIPSGERHTDGNKVKQEEAGRRGQGAITTRRPEKVRMGRKNGTGE